MFQATYGESINPLPPFNEWCFPTDFINVQPPLMDKRPAGRPKNVVRIRSKDEVVSSTICSRCNHEGHNRSKCPHLAPSGCSKGKKSPIPKSQRNDASGTNNDAYHPFETNQYYPFYHKPNSFETNQHYPFEQTNPDYETPKTEFCFDLNVDG